jgi:transcriptional regulator with XRE-family HTH domain
MNKSTSSKHMLRLDRHIGLRLKMRRLLMELTLSDLALKSGITFQQIQKYEQAKNRISASKLYLFSNILGVEVSYFYEGYRDLP